MRKTPSQEIGLQMRRHENTIKCDHQIQIRNIFHQPKPYSKLDNTENVKKRQGEKNNKIIASRQEWQQQQQKQQRQQQSHY